MALVNCEIVKDSTVSQVSGGDNIAAYYLYIKPAEGYNVAAGNFTDNTWEEYGDSLQHVIQFDENSKLTLEDTTTPDASDNQVKITVNLLPGYSISEDTTITVDIDGEATLTPVIAVHLNLFERMEDPFYGDGSVVIDLESGVTNNSSTLLSVSQGMIHKVHRLSYNGEATVETKIATITLKATTSSDIDVVNYIKNVNPAIRPWWIWPDQMDDGFRLEYEEYPNIGENDSTAPTSFLGEVITNKHFVVYYTPRADFDYVAWGTSPGALSNSAIGANVIFNAVVGSAAAPSGSRSITNVTTDLGSLPSGSFNVIPSSGITPSNTPIVKVYGTPGATFKVEFKESKVVEGISSSRSTNTGAVDYFGGIIPNMPVGVIVIPKSGMYTFKIPSIAAFTTTGWKEFEMKITASYGTIIKSSAVKTGGTSVNIGASGSIVTNKFYQYPKVNIALAVKDITSAGWGYTDGYTDIIQLPSFGGSGSGKYGVPMMPASSRFINFEIRVTKTGGVFSLSNAFDKSQFVATERSNRDVVSFYNLKARIGEGLTDTTATFATITGTIRCGRFGFGDQVYTLDLSKIFTFA